MPKINKKTIFRFDRIPVSVFQFENSKNYFVRYYVGRQKDASSGNKDKTLKTQNINEAKVKAKKSEEGNKELGGAFRDTFDEMELHEMLLRGIYAFGYENNGFMLLSPMALIVVGIIIWVQRARSKHLIEE